MTSPVRPARRQPREVGDATVEKAATTAFESTSLHPPPPRRQDTLVPRSQPTFGARCALLLHGSAIEQVVGHASQPASQRAFDPYPLFSRQPERSDLHAASAEAERLGDLLAELRGEQERGPWTQRRDDRIQWLEQARATAAKMEAFLLRAELEGQLGVSFEEAERGFERARALLGQGDDEPNPATADRSSSDPP